MVYIWIVWVRVSQFCVRVNVTVWFDDGRFRFMLVPMVLVMYM